MARQGSFLSASDFTGLKALVKQECQRRCREGSVSNYAGANYDYSTTPASGVAVDIEHYRKLYEPLAAINSSGLTSKSQHSAIDGSSMDAIANKVSQLANYSMTQNGSTGCSASCTGLCTTGCYNQCTSCTGDCTATCTGTCTGSCTGCQGSCTGSCTGGCTGGCSGCSSCSGCSGSCSGGCQGCGSGCAGCSGCGNGCSTGCGSDCQLVNCGSTCVVGCSWTGKPECLFLESEE